MLARHCAQFEQPRLSRFEPVGIIFQGACRLMQLGFGIVGIDDRAIETGERFGKQRMVARAIKNAREMALLPYHSKRMSS
jgi:hypothetical protein